MVWELQGFGGLGGSETLNRPESPKIVGFETFFWLQRGMPGPPAPMAAVAQLYLGSMTFSAAREARGSFGLRVAVVEPSAKI